MSSLPASSDGANFTSPIIHTGSDFPAATVETAAQESACKLEEAMQSSSPLQEDRELDNPGDHPEQHTNNDTPEECDPDLMPTGSLLLSVPSQAVSLCRNKVAAARRAATRLKLHPYQCDIVAEFCMASTISHQATILMHQFVLENKLDTIIAATPAFVVSNALLENIKSYAIAVMLSSKLSAYKGTVPQNHVLAIVLHYKLHIPDNIDKDTYAWGWIIHAVQTVLTQLRSDIKKEVHDSKSGDIKDSLSIYDLALKIIGSSRCTSTTPLCTRLALLQRIHAEDPSNKFWDMVDSRLSLIRKTAKNDKKKITKAFALYLTKDCVKYGTTPVYTINTEADAMQQEVDNVIEPYIETVLDGEVAV